MAKVGIETTQHVQLSQAPAGVTERILAYILDFIVLGVFYFVLWYITVDSGLLNNVIENQWVIQLVIFLPIMLYHLLMEIFWNGFTVGKWFVGIRVVREDGGRPSVSNFLVRWLIRLFEVTLTSGVVAFFAILINGKGQRLGDLAAGTRVVKILRKTSLEDTVLDFVDEEYEPVIAQVVELKDEDISIINEVLKSRGDYDKSTWLHMVARTRVLIQNRIGNVANDMGDTQFLRQVVKDYNATYGRIE